MIRSMTGVGRAESTLRPRKSKIIVEIRSSNHKFLELNMKLPNPLLSYESEIRELITKNIMRGSLQLMINISCANSDRTVNHDNTYPRSFTLDYDLLANLINIKKELKEKFKIEGELNINTVLAFPGIIVPSKSTETNKNKQIWVEAQKTIVRALKSLNKMKKEEGAFLYKDFIRRIKTILVLLSRIEKRSRQIRQELHKKSINNINIERNEPPQIELLKATTEEMVRLTSHAKAFLRTIRSKKIISVGRKLEFILSEMLRETETILAKGRDTLISRDGIAIKEEVDALREQVRNVE